MKGNVHLLYIQKLRKTRKLYIYIYKELETFKNQENLRYIFINKKPHTLRYALFHEIFETGIYIYTKASPFALRDIFIYTKSLTLRKKQDN